VHPAGVPIESQITLELEQGKRNATTKTELASSSQGSGGDHQSRCACGRRRIHLAPGVPLATVLLYSIAGALIFLAVLLTAAALTLSAAQFSLRHGGTDPQWFWFAAEPPGIAGVRKQLAAESARIKAD
jgi:hypothetical protein